MTTRRDVLRYGGIALGATALSGAAHPVLAASPNARFSLDFSDAADVADNTPTSAGWVLDRYSSGYPPVSFTRAMFDGDYRLCIDISETGPTSGFYISDEDGNFVEAKWVYLGLPKKLKTDPEEGGWVDVEAQVHKTSTGAALKWRVNNKLVVNCLGVKWFETRSVSSSRKSKISVRPRGFPWFSRIPPLDHRPDSLERSVGSRSGRPRPPMPAVSKSQSDFAGCTRAQLL
nr:hypothetical protein [Haloferax larsenii]